MSDKQLKVLETEIAYLRKEIEKLITEKPVEIHCHYHHDYSKIKDITDHFKDNFE